VSLQLRELLTASEKKKGKERKKKTPKPNSWHGGE
jgi:hypothetical protein